MRRNTLLKIFIIAACCPLLFSQAITPPQSVSELQQKWTWAQAEATTRGIEEGFWISYGITKEMPADEFILGSNIRSWGTAIRITGRPFYQHIPGAAPPGPTPPTDPGTVISKEIALLLGFEGGTGLDHLKRVRLSDVTMPVDLDDRPLIWLGSSRLPESFNLLESLYGELDRPAMKRRLLRLIGFHPIPEVTRFLSGVVGSQASDTVRAESASQMAHQNNREALKILIEISAEDSSMRVRQVAISAIGHMDIPQATDALIDIALNGKETIAKQASDLFARPYARAGNQQRALPPSKPESTA